LKRGLPVQCLPSNRLLRPRDQADAAVVAAHDVLASAVPAGAEETAHPGAVQARLASRDDDRAEGVAAAEADPPLADNRRLATPVGGGKVEAKSAAAPLHKPSPQLLSALGMQDGKEKAKAETPDRDISGAWPRAQGEVDRKYQEDGRESKAAKAAGREVEGGTSVDEGEEDPWFESFFLDSKKLADAKAEEEVRHQEEQRRTAERSQKEREEQSEERKREERAQRRAVQEQGKSAMEARLQAQRRAAEAKKQVDRERKAAEKGKKAEAQRSPGKPRKDRSRESPATRSAQEERHEAPSRAIVRAEEGPLVQESLQRRRTSWEENWMHPCAGDRKPDGSAIFCYPCDGWINLGDPFDHGGFELHCEKVGHYGWID